MSAQPSTSGLHNSGRVPVLIAGGGPAGLALAIELGWRGVSCLLVEESDGTVEFATTNLANTRTSEHLRRWGLVEDVRGGGFPLDYPRNYIFVTRLDGYELVRFEHPSNGEGRSPYSPEGRIWCPKPFFDPVLQRHAQSLPTVQVRYGVRLESFRQDEHGVVALVAIGPSGREERIVAEYLVACDGGASTIRRQLGIELQGKFVEGLNLAIFFRSPLLPHHAHGKAVMYQIVNAKVQGAVAAIDGNEEWRLNLRGIRPGDLESIDTAQYLRYALGSKIPFEVSSVRPWTAHRVVAESYRRGRVFVAGDAAHLLWPAGGFGMNTAVGDSVDLGWKLAATLRGWGGPNLLDSYETERRPIGIRNVTEAGELRAGLDAEMPTSATLDEDSEEGARIRRKAAEVILKTRGKEFAHDSPGIELGYRYEESPICIPDGTPAPPLDHAVYLPTTWPGARAPHAWLKDGRSTLDLFGRGFTLLRLSARGLDASRFEAAAAQCRLPLGVVDLDEPGVRELYERRFVLVRPDGHVAWRADDLPNDPTAVANRVRGA